MAELALTANRRTELAALLDDEQRLREEYPRVSDYLEMAPNLAGTGNPQVDAAFDLRFVHYVTGGSKESPNPYWDIVAPFVTEQDGRRTVNGGNPEGSARMAYAQMLLQAIYSYAIPSPETINWISTFCADRPVVELGAGRGYWAAQMARAGVKVEAYDSEPPDKTENMSFTHAAGQADMWHHVGPVEDLKYSGPDQVLFLCWPPGWGNKMASEALATFEQQGGTRLVYIGQPKGGMTGTDAFFDALAANWQLDSEDQQHVAWWNLADVAQSWTRR